MKSFSQWLEVVSASPAIQKLSDFMQSASMDLDQFEKQVGYLIYTGSERKQIMWFQFLKNAIRELEAIKGRPQSYETESLFIKPDGEIVSISSVVRTLKWIIKDNFH